MENSSVSHAYAVLKGFRLGDVGKAIQFLRSLDPVEAQMRNREESRTRVRVKKRHRLGVPPRRLRRAR